MKIKLSAIRTYIAALVMDEKTEYAKGYNKALKDVLR